MSERGDRTQAHPPKTCLNCGASFYKLSKLTLAAWAQTQFCSNRCRAASKRRERVDKDGRVRIWVGDRLRWRSHVVMERMLARPLRSGEVVDHKDGDPTNDQPSNLRLFASHAEHMANHWAEGTIVRLAGTNGGTRAMR